MLADLVKNLKLSPTLALNQRALELKSQGRKIISLAAGEPDFPTPPWIIEAAHKAALNGATRYTAVAGTPDLRQAIVEKLFRENHLKYSPKEIVVGTGGKQIIFNALMATLNPGDEVIVPSPYWVSYPEMVSLFGGHSVIVPCAEANSFKLSPKDLEAAITPRTKWLILNAPSNPTGVMYTFEELWALAQVIRRNPHLMVMSDDIYEHLLYDNLTFQTIADVEPEIKHQVLIVNGVSKSFSMTGWRIGYGAGPEALISAMVNIQSQSTSNACSVAQAAALAALKGDQTFLNEWRTSFAKRRDQMLDLLLSIPNVTCVKPQGAFYLFPNMMAYLGTTRPDTGDRIATDMDLSNYLLESAGIAVMPGSAFGAPGFLRLSFAISAADIEEGLKCLQEGLQKLTP